MDKIFVGQRVSKLDTGRPPEPVSRVTLVVDGENAYTAGDDTGRAVEKTVPWATQAMADAVLRSLRGVTYRPFEGTDAILDPAAEIGDAVTVAGVYSTLAKADITFDGLYTSDIAAPGGDEVEDEYPYQSRSQRQYQRDLAKVRSSITKTAERITLLVENEIEGVYGKLELTATSLTTEINNTREGLSSKIEQTATSIQTQVNGLSGAVSTIRQTVDSISLGVVNGSDSSTITLYKDNIAIASRTISFTGMVTFNDLNGKNGTTIDGGAINTNTLRLNSLYGNYIYVNDAAGRVAAIITATGASSYAGQKFLLSSGAVEIDAGYGDIYLSSSSGALQIGNGRAAVTGDMIPSATNRYNCGTSGFRWSDVYTTNGPVSSSDRAGKKDIDYDMSRYSGLFDRLRPCSFLRTDGTSGRRHHGFIAQDVGAALKAEGLTGQDFAGYVAWEGGYGLRYEEIIAMLVHEVQELKKERRLAQ